MFVWQKRADNSVHMLIRILRQNRRMNSNHHRRSAAKSACGCVRFLRSILQRLERALVQYYFGRRRSSVGNGTLNLRTNGELVGMKEWTSPLMAVMLPLMLEYTFIPWQCGKGKLMIM
jgi:hypothetical protein